MKKVIITLAAIFAAATVLSAKPTGLNLGGGVAYEGFNIKNTLTGATDYSDFVGAYAEVGYDWKLAKNCYIYFGGRYIEGFRSDGTSSVIDITRTGNIQVPVYYQQNFPVGKKKTKLYIEAGPTFDFWALFLNTASNGGHAVTTNYFEDGSFNRFNVYLGGNFGIKINMHAKIYVGGEYGLIDLAKSDLVQNNRWQIKIGAAYIF